MTPAIPPGFTRLPTYAAGKTVSESSSVAVLSANGIQAWRHESSGVRIILFGATGPLASATIVVGTEPISNGGHPHTLEHIIFLGSKRYPQRGYLDNLACRCLAYGTNAWTADEYTAYTTKTAGFEGLSILLPCFLDHVLNPTMSEQAFASEVYHVRKDGSEGGVVFSEMQARENSEADLADRALREMLWGGSPLGFEAGGVCEEIRQLRNEAVVRFHREQYCGANVSVIVGGHEIEEGRLLQCVKPVLDEVVERGRPRWNVEWKMRELRGVERRVVRFPCADEELGSVLLGWRIPGVAERRVGVAVDCLLRFLAHDVWSPLRQKFVEVDLQMASDIEGGVESFWDGCAVSLSFGGVQHLEGDEDEDVEGEGEDVDLETVESEVESVLLSGRLEREVMELLGDIVRDGLAGGVEAMRVAIVKEAEAQLTELESGSHEAVPYHLIEEVVYGHRGGLVIGEETRGFLEVYKSLEEEDEAFWLDLLKRYIVDAPRVEIIMVPDATLAEQLAEQDKQACSKRLMSLSKDQVAKLETQTEEQVTCLRKTSFESSVFPPLPNTLNISRWPYTVSQHQDKGYTSQSVTIGTDFVHCTLFLDTTRLSLHQRALLPILCELIPTSDILLSDNTYLAYTDNSRSISEHTVSTDRSGLYLGFDGDLAHQCVVLHFASRPETFSKAAQVMLRTLFQAELTVERMAAVAQTLQANATADLRDGDAVLAAAVQLLPVLHLDDVPNYALSNFMGALPLIEFLAIEFTKAKPRKSVQRNIIRHFHDALNALRQLADSDIFVQIVAKEPAKAHEEFAQVWFEKRQGYTLANGISSDKLAISLEAPLPLHAHRLNKVISIPGVESCSVDIRLPCAIHDAHADWSALSVLLSMLSRMEGPLCRAIRGTGLAYGISIGHAPWLGQIVTSISETSAPAAAWEAYCETLERFRKQLDGNELEADLETAKAAMLFSLHRKRCSPEAVGSGVVARTAVGVAAGGIADRAVEEAVERVGMRDLKVVFDRYLRVGGGGVVVVCGTGGGGGC